MKAIRNEIIQNINRVKCIIIRLRISMHLLFMGNLNVHNNTLHKIGTL